MNNELINQGLLIAAIGMGLVFVVIIFLWGLMALLMRLTSGGEAPTKEALTTEVQDSGLVPELEKTERQRQAAAAAVAVSLAFAASQKRDSVPSSPARSGGVTAWQAFHRSRKINPKERRG